MIGQRVQYQGKTMWVTGYSSGFGSQDYVYLSPTRHVMTQEESDARLRVLLSEFPHLKELKGRIVTWAPYGEHIPVTCVECGAKYHTKNIESIGSRSIFAYNSDCEHSIDSLEPDENEYKSRGVK